MKRHKKLITMDDVMAARLVIVEGKVEKNTKGGHFDNAVFVLFKDGTYKLERDPSFTWGGE